MTRNPAARRVHRDAAAPDDAFVAGVLETSVWAREHSRTLIIGGAIAVALILGLVLFVTNRAQKREQAIAQLTQTRAVALSGNTELAIRDLEQYIERFDGTPEAREARLMLGRAYLEGNQPQKAIEAVGSLVDDLDTDLGVNAAMLTAAAHESAQEAHRAEALLMRVGEEARFLFQKQDALDNAARIRLQRGDAAGAVQLYERLIELTPMGDGERQVWELRLGEARALAHSGSAAGPPAATTGG